MSLTLAMLPALTPTHLHTSNFPTLPPLRSNPRSFSPSISFSLPLPSSLYLALLYTILLNDSPPRLPLHTNTDTTNSETPAHSPILNIPPTDPLLSRRAPLLGCSCCSWPWPSSGSTGIQHSRAVKHTLVWRFVGLQYPASADLLGFPQVF